MVWAVQRHAHEHARHDKTRQDKTTQDKTRQDKTKIVGKGQDKELSQEKKKEKTRTKKIVQGQGITSRQRASRLRAWRLAVVISWH